MTAVPNPAAAVAAPPVAPAPVTPAPIVPPANPDVFHKSGDWLYPNGYPNMPHDGSLKPVGPWPERHPDRVHIHTPEHRAALASAMNVPLTSVPESVVVVPGLPCTRFQIPYVGEPDLSVEDKAYLVSRNHWYAVSEKPADLVDAVAASYITSAGLTINSSAVATYNDYIASLNGAAPNRADFNAFAIAKHSVQATGNAASSSAAGGTAAA